MDALFLAELSERLIVHYSQGQWRAPMGQRQIPVARYDGAHLGRIVCAEATDIERAVAGLRGASEAQGAITEAWRLLRPLAAQLRHVEGFDDPADMLAVQRLPGKTPLVMLSAAQTPIAALVAVLVAGAGRGVLWKPAPNAAASAHLVMRALGPLSGGSLALVQGDHTTGAVLAGMGDLVWASDAPVPDGLGVPMLTLSAKAPRRR
jgi:acyl-CoA reductase-like NAD-dependent aldehyde dehydrogenase